MIKLRPSGKLNFCFLEEYFLRTKIGIHGLFYLEVYFIKTLKVMSRDLGE